MDFEGIIEFLGLIGGLIILILLIKINKLNKRYIPLIVYVVLVIVEIIVSLTIESNPKRFAHLLYVTEPFSMLYGFLIYIYARNQSNPKLYLQKTDWFLLIPFGLAILSYLPYYLLSAKKKISDYLNIENVQLDVLDNIWEWNFEIVLSSAFLIAALLELKKYNLNIKEQVSDIRNIDLHLTSLIIKVAIISYLFELAFVYLTFFGFPYSSLLFDIFLLLNYVVVIFIGYDAFITNKHIKLLHDGWAKTTETKVNINGQLIKYAKSTLSADSSDKIKSRLLEYMKEQKPYLESKIRIKDLSELTGIPSHHLSQVINESFQQNFYEFVNSYRIAEAQKLLKDPQYKDYTYTAIGYEVGFNSKSAFYTAFKKITGTTPAKF